MAWQPTKNSFRTPTLLTSCSCSRVHDISDQNWSTVIITTEQWTINIMRLEDTTMLFFLITLSGVSDTPDTPAYRVPEVVLSRNRAGAEVSRRRGHVMHEAWRAGAGGGHIWRHRRVTIGALVGRCPPVTFHWKYTLNQTAGETVKSHGWERKGVRKETSKT